MQHALAIVALFASAQAQPGGGGGPPPRGGPPGGGPPGGGGGGGGGGGAVSGHAAPLVGAVAYTTVDVLPHKEWMSSAPGHAGEEIYGLFEAGFGDAQSNILEALGCSDGSLGHVAGGIDTVTAESMIAHQCGIELPRFDGDDYVSLLDLCGGHTHEYHFHERLSCLYDVDDGHSPQVAVGNDVAATPIFGMWEDTGALAVLDACGGHFGDTPEGYVYHHHVQEEPPFIVGCYGPSDSGEEVTLDECRSYYPDVCGDDVQTLTLKDGTEVPYDPWCPCFNHGGLNDGSPDAPAATGPPAAAPTALPAAAPTADGPYAPTLEPAPAPTPRPTVPAPSPEPTAPPAPTAAPTAEPTTAIPTYAPSKAPTLAPLPAPTAKPTTEPTASLKPSIAPVAAPTAEGGACVDDASWRQFSRGRVKDDRDCAWLDGRDSKKRCDRYKDEAGVKARDACCVCDQYYAPAPTPAPTPLGFCADDDDWLHKGKRGRGCEWLANKGASKSRCDRYKDKGGVRASQACGCVCSEYN